MNDTTAKEKILSLNSTAIPRRAYIAKCQQPQQHSQPSQYTPHTHTQPPHTFQAQPGHTPVQVQNSFNPLQTIGDYDMGASPPQTPGYPSQRQNSWTRPPSFLRKTHHQPQTPPPAPPKKFNTPPGFQNTDPTGPTPTTSSPIYQNQVTGQGYDTKQQAIMQQFQNTVLKMGEILGNGKPAQDNCGPIIGIVIQLLTTLMTTFSTPDN